MQHPGTRRAEGSRGRGVGDWGWKGGVSECEAITVKVEPNTVVRILVAVPTEQLVIAGTAVMERIIARPTREEIVTVTTCEHGGETVQGMSEGPHDMMRSAGVSRWAYRRRSTRCLLSRRARHCRQGREAR